MAKILCATTLFFAIWSPIPGRIGLKRARKRFFWGKKSVRGGKNPAPREDPDPASPARSRNGARRRQNLPDRRFLPQNDDFQENRQNLRNLTIFAGEATFPLGRPFWRWGGRFQPSQRDSGAPARNPGGRPRILVRTADSRLLRDRSQAPQGPILAGSWRQPGQPGRQPGQAGGSLAAAWRQPGEDLRGDRFQAPQGPPAGGILAPQDRQLAGSWRQGTPQDRQLADLASLAASFGLHLPGNCWLVLAVGSSRPTNLGRSQPWLFVAF